MAIIHKINSLSIKLDKICSVNYGLRPSSEKLGLKKEAFIHEHNDNDKLVKYFEGKDMGYWLIKFLQQKNPTRLQIHQL
ncbi:hypothetical protein [Treponema sp.]|uniref:hypothetical protein n=1 Tax=Treponema sp. TaxID=166 RepID=UPI003FD86467